MRQQGKNFQRADEAAGFVHQADAVGIAVQGQTDGSGAGGRHAAAKLREVGGDGFGLRHSGESRVGFGAQFGHGGAAARQQAGDVAGAGAVHRIHQYGQAGIADGVQVNQAGDRFPVGRAGVNVPQQAGGAGGVRRDGARRAGGCDAHFQRIGNRLAGAAAQSGFELETAPGRRVVAGGDDHAGAGAAPRHFVTDDRRRRRRRAQIDGYFAGGNDRGHGFGKLAGGKAGIVAHHQAARGQTVGAQVVGQPLGATGHIGKGKVGGDDAAPAVSAEFDRRVHTPILAQGMPGCRGQSVPGAINRRWRPARAGARHRHRRRDRIPAAARQCGSSPYRTPS